MEAAFGSTWPNNNGAVGPYTNGSYAVPLFAPVKPCSTRGCGPTEATYQKHVSQYGLDIDDGKRVFFLLMHAALQFHLVPDTIWMMQTPQSKEYFMT